jgi:hypothetical protein
MTTKKQVISSHSLLDGTYTAVDELHDTDWHPALWGPALNLMDAYSMACFGVCTTACYQVILGQQLLWVQKGS